VLQSVYPEAVQDRNGLQKAARFRFRQVSLVGNGRRAVNRKPPVSVARLGA